MKDIKCNVILFLTYIIMGFLHRDIKLKTYGEIKVVWHNALLFLK